MAGFGAEWAWTDRVSIRSEVLYVDFVDRENRFLFAPPAGFANFTESDSMWISRIALNYKFGAPVAASTDRRDTDDTRSRPRQQCRGPYLLSPRRHCATT